MEDLEYYINGCLGLSDLEKKQAIADIYKMIHEKKYAEHVLFETEEFKNYNPYCVLVNLFLWQNSDLGAEFWKKVGKKLKRST